MGIESATRFICCALSNAAAHILVWAALFEVYMTALDLIKGAMRLCQIIATGETPAPEEANDALEILNELMESLSIGTLSVWNQPTQTFNLVPSQFNYTIGPSANFNTVKPERIIDAYINDNGISYPVTLVTQQQYDELAFKAQPSPYPCYLLHISGPAVGNIVLWPVPNKAITLTLNMDAQFTPFASLTDTVTWPPGYKKMIRYLLAIDICADFGVDVPAVVVAGSLEASAAVKRLNSKLVTPLRYDYAINGRRGYGQLLTGLSGGY